MSQAPGASESYRADAAVAGAPSSATPSDGAGDDRTEPKEAVEPRPQAEPRRRRRVSSACRAGALLDKVRQACKDTDKQLSGLLNGSCEVKSEEGDVVTLGFYHTFHLERIESGPYAQRLEELFSTRAGAQG